MGRKNKGRRGRKGRERLKRHRGGRREKKEKISINLLITYLALINQIFMQGGDG